MRDLHMHTVYSDGKNTPEEMIEEALRLGLDTVGISDHSHLDPCGMTLEATEEYHREIARLKEKYAGQIRVLCGLERDFISDDFSDYDYVIGSVHLLTMPDGHHVSIDWTADKQREGVEKYFGGDWYALAEAFYATEAKVVNKLAQQGIKKTDLSRDEFLKHAWDWTHEHGGIILQQLRKLGASCDWDRTAFTMDEKRSKSVIKVVK